MKVNPDAKELGYNVISFKKYKEKKPEMISSTIAAIIAVKIDHPNNMSPEDFFINQLELMQNNEILAFEDALDNDAIGLTTKDAQNEASNDAWYFVILTNLNTIYFFTNFQICGTNKAASSILYKSPIMNG